MIIVSENDGTVTSSKNKGQSMSVNITGSSFKFMLDNLYTQPHRAIVRELSCNAWDSQVIAKNLIPFHIQIPSKFNPIFKIRDYGTGLDKEEINKYLNCLYSSNKGGTNEQIGGFGLGSKSAFALVPSFFISSYKDGIEYKCFWYRDAEGIPVLKVQSEKPTEEPNGILYNITFDTKDVNQIADACLTELLGLPIKPRFFTDLNDESSEVDILKEENITYGYSCDNYWDISLPNTCKVMDCFGSRRHYNSTNTLISIGGVLYPIPSNVQLYTVTRNIPLYNLLVSDKKLTVINFPIGSLSLPSTREHILNTTENATVIMERVKEVLTQYVNDFSLLFKEMYKDQDLTKFKTLVSSIFSYTQYRSVNVNQEVLKLFSSVSSSDLDCKYNELIKKITNSDLKDKIGSQDLYNLVQLKWSNTLNSRYPLELFKMKKIKSDFKTSSSSYDGIQFAGLNSLDSSKKILLVYNSSKKFMGSYLQGFKDINSYTNIYRVNIEENFFNTFISLINDSEMFDILKEHLELHNLTDKVTLIDDSTLTKPENLTTIKSVRTDLPINGIRTCNITSVNGLSFNGCNTIPRKFTDEGKTIPFDSTYLVDKDVVVYIDKSKYKYIRNYSSFYYLQLLGINTIYCLKSEDYLEQLKKACEDSGKTLINFSSEEIDYTNYYDQDVPIDLVKEIVTLLYIKNKVKQSIRSSTLDKYLKEGCFPILSEIIIDKVKPNFTGFNDFPLIHLCAPENGILVNYINYCLPHLFEKLITFEDSPLESLDYDSLLASVKDSTDPLTFEVITHLLNFKHEGK